MTTLSRDLRFDRSVRLLAGFGALRFDQLEALLLLHEELTPQSRRVATYRVLADLRESGFVETVGLTGRVGRGVLLSATGRRAYAASDRAFPPTRARRGTSVVLLDHAIALADIAVTFGRAASRQGVDLLWESDWEAVARLGSTVVIPDALVTLDHAGWRVRGFIEADRATERHEAFAAKVRRYVDLYLRDKWRDRIGSWPLILTVTTSDVRARSLAELAHETAIHAGGARIAHAFRTITFDALSANGPFASQWHVSGGERALLLPAKDSSPSKEIDAPIVDGGRSGASGSRSEGNPSATSQVGGLA